MVRKTILLSFALLLFCLASMNFAAGRSDVADAAMKGDKAALRTLLAQKADVNAPQVDGATALHWASHWDDLELPVPGPVTKAAQEAWAEREGTMLEDLG